MYFWKYVLCTCHHMFSTYPDTIWPSQLCEPAKISQTTALWTFHQTDITLWPLNWWWPGDNNTHKHIFIQAWRSEMCNKSLVWQTQVSYPNCGGNMVRYVRKKMITNSNFEQKSFRVDLESWDWGTKDLPSCYSERVSCEPGGNPNSSPFQTWRLDQILVGFSPH